MCAYELAKSALNSGRKGKKCEILSAGESERCEESRLVKKGMEWGPRAKKGGEFTKGIECLFFHAEHWGREDELLRKRKKIRMRNLYFCHILCLQVEYDDNDLDEELSKVMEAAEEAAEDAGEVEAVEEEEPEDAEDAEVKAASENRYECHSYVGTALKAA